MPLATMNWKRGLLRLWAVVSVVFIAVVSLDGYHTVTSEFGAYQLQISKAWQYDELAKRYNGEKLLPVLCGPTLRGKINSDYRIDPGNSGCWYTMSKFRTFYPEYNDLNDIELSDNVYAKFSGSQNRFQRATPWPTLFRLAIVAIGIPLFVLAVGFTGFWVGRGFKRSDADEK